MAMSMVSSKTSKEPSKAGANSQEATSRRSFHRATEAKSCLISLEKKILDFTLNATHSE